MLARSTAWRHGDGRTCTKNTSIRSTLPSRTIRLAGLMSRWARPASHSWRTIVSAWSITSSSTSASPISSAPSKNSVTSRYSRSGVISTMPYGRRRSGCRCRAGAGPRSPRTRRGGAPTGTAPRPRAARRGSSGRACTSGRPGRGSSRRASRTGTCRGRPRPSGAAASSRPSPRGPTGLMSSTVSPSWSCTACADRLAPPAADVEVRGLAPPVGDREHLVRGEEAEGVDRDGDGEARPRRRCRTGGRWPGTAARAAKSATSSGGDDLARSAPATRPGRASRRCRPRRTRRPRRAGRAARSRPTGR